MKIFLSWIVILSIILIPAAAQDDIAISVTHAFSGYCKTETIQPILVQVVNRGKYSIQGIIRVYQRGDDFSSASPYYQQKISLPAPSTKILRFYIFWRSGKTIHAQLRGYTNNKRVAMSTLLEVDNDRQAGYIPYNYYTSDQKKARKLWVQVYNRQRPSPYSDKGFLYAPAIYQYFPDVGSGIQSADIVELTEPQGFSLNSKQVAALLEWTAQGGTLILSGALFQNVVRQDRWPPSLMRLFDENTTEIAYGRGRVFYSPTTKSESLLTAVAGTKIHVRDPGSSYVRQYLSKKLRGEVEIAWLVWLLAIYLLFIGPIDYWLCKKWKLPALTWVLFLVTIVAFTTVAYFKTYWLKSGPIQMHIINCADVVPQQNKLIGRSFFGIYSTRHANYQFSSEIPGCYTAADANENLNLFPITIDVEGRNTLLTTPIPTYSTRTYGHIWSRDYTFDDNAHFDVTSATLHLALPSETNVEKMFLVTKDGYYYRPFTPSESPTGQWSMKKAENQGIHFFLEGKNYWEIDKPQAILKTLSFFGHMQDVIQNSANPDNYYLSPPSTYENQFDISQQLTENSGVLLLFVADSLNTIHVVGESPVYEQLNLLRVVIPLQREE